MTTGEIKVLIDQWIEMYIKQTVAYSTGDTPTYEEINSWLNLLIQQGDDTAQTVAYIRDYLEQYAIEHAETHAALTTLINQTLETVTSRFNQADKAIADMRIDFNSFKQVTNTTVNNFVNDMNAAMDALRIQTVADVTVMTDNVLLELQTLSTTVARYKEETLADAQSMVSAVAIYKGEIESLLAGAGNVIDGAQGVITEVSTFKVATGTGTIINLADLKLTDGYSRTFIVKANNGGAYTTINGKPLYKPNTTLTPMLVAGKAVTVWYNVANACFFIKASAEGNAVAANVLAGYKFSNDEDNDIPGTMVNNGSVIITPKAGQQVIPPGYHNGLGRVTGDDNLIPANIRGGSRIFDIDGDVNVMDTSDATATAPAITVGNTACVKGVKITGTMTNRGGLGHDVEYVKGLQNAGSSYVQAKIPMIGRYDTNSYLQINDPNLISANIKAGSEIFKVPGKASVVDTAGATAAAWTVLKDYTFYKDGARVVGTMPFISGNASQQYPVSTIQVGAWSGDGVHYVYFGVPNGSYLNNVSWIASAQPDLVATNILAGKNICGVAGTAVAGRRYASGTESTVYTTDQVQHAQAGGQPITLNGQMCFIKSGLAFTPTFVVVKFGSFISMVYAGDTVIHYKATGINGVPNGNMSRFGDSRALITANGFYLPSGIGVANTYTWEAWE